MYRHSVGQKEKKRGVHWESWDHGITRTTLTLLSKGQRNSCIRWNERATGINLEAYHHPNGQNELLVFGAADR